MFTSGIEHTFELSLGAQLQPQLGAYLREDPIMPASDNRLTTAEMAEFVANGFLSFDKSSPRTD